MATIASAGLLAGLPFFHAASRLNRPKLRYTGAAMVAGSLVGFGLLSASENSVGEPTGWLSDVATVVLLAVIIVSTVLLVGLRREVYQQPAVIRPTSGNHGAMAAVQAARRQRNAARELAERDPLMARELGIGRPEIQRSYDDGGLLDLNFASAEQLIAAFALPRDMADGVISARESLGRFSSVDDALVFGQIGERYSGIVRDRGIVISVQ